MTDYPGSADGARRNDGFAMLEVLITIVVIAIGLLGLAGLQATGLRNNHSAHLRSVATQLASDMADRMRANMAGFNADEYNNKATPLGQPTCPCLPADMANSDLFEWSIALTALPSGEGLVCRDSTPGDDACDNLGSLYIVQVKWDDNKSGAANTRFFMNFTP